MKTSVRAFLFLTLLLTAILALAACEFPAIPGLPGATTTAATTTDDAGTTTTSVVTTTEGAQKQVPVYQGMSISSPYGTASLAVAYDNGNNGNNGNHYGQYKGDHTDRENVFDENDPFPEGSESIEEAASSLEVIGSLEEMYCTTPNSDIYIYIHIDNPDNYEILSFTLNGKKYSNYMFEPGSDMETLILKYNVGDVRGVVEYTIDAIKYVDGVDIRDVAIGGDRTVKAGVRVDDQVSATISDLTTDIDSLSFRVDLADPDALLSYFNGTVKAVLYDGEALVSTRELTLGQNTVSFDGLIPNKVYQYAIVGYYNDLSGEEFGAHVLAKSAIMTDPILLFSDIEISHRRLGFDYWRHGEFLTQAITSLRLYREDALLADLPLDTTEITGNMAVGNVRLVAEYLYEGEPQTITLYATLPVVEPTLTANVNKTDSHYFAYNATINDPDETGAIISKIEILRGDKLIKTVDADVREIDGLLGNTAYVLRFTYVYNCYDGQGDREKTFDVNITTKRGLVFALNDAAKTATVTNYEGESRQLTIPPSVEGYTVVAIAENAFKDSELCSVEIPGNVKSIGAGAFSGCHYLSSLSLAEGITEIGDRAFADARSLGTLLIPESVTKVGSDLLLNVTALVCCAAAYQPMGWAEDWMSDTHTVVWGYLGSGETEDGFLWYKTLAGIVLYSYTGDATNVTIPETIDGTAVTKIMKHTFYACSSLRSIFVPSVITTVEEAAFYYCKGAVILCEAEKRPSGWHSAFYAWCGDVIWGCSSEDVSFGETEEGFLYYTAKGIFCILGYQGTATELTIPSTINGLSITMLPDGIFKNNSSLVKVTIPDTITEIGSNTFLSCKSLTTVILPASLTEIGESAFQGCSALTTVNLPATLTSIGKSAFYDCSALTAVNLPAALTSIEESTFYGCSALSTVTFSEGILTIGKNAFTNCLSLGKLVFPNTLTSIGEQAFRSCLSLYSVTLGENLSSIERNAFSNSYKIAEIYNLSPYITLRKNDSNGNGGITTMVLDIYTSKTEPSKLVETDDGFVFHVQGSRIRLIGYVGEETALTLPATYNGAAYSLHNYAFYLDTKISSLHIPATVTVSSALSFYGSTITEFTVDSAHSSLKASDGSLYSKDGKTLIRYAHGKTDNVFYVPLGVTTIGDYAFAGSTALQTVYLPEGLVTIGRMAFQASGITSLVIPASVTKIDIQAFAQCRALTAVTFKDPSGWSIEGDLADPAEAARLLTTTPSYNKAWVKTPN